MAPQRSRALDQFTAKSQACLHQYAVVRLFYDIVVLNFMRETIDNPDQSWSSLWKMYKDEQRGRVEKLNQKLTTPTHRTSTKEKKVMVRVQYKGCVHVLDYILYTTVSPWWYGL